MTARNALHTEEDVFAEIEQAFGFVPNLFRAYAAYPPLLSANWAKVRAILLQGALRREVKETIALLISKDNACNYCIDAHTATLRMLGFSPQTVAIMESSLADADFSVREQALIDFARRASREPKRMAGDLGHLRTLHIPPAEIVETLGVMELFAAFTRFAEVLGIEPDALP